MKKYIVYPGTIISKYDGEKHKISASKVAELCGLNPQECYLINKKSKIKGLPKNLPRFFPRDDGHYDH